MMNIHFFKQLDKDEELQSNVSNFLGVDKSPKILQHYLIYLASDDEIIEVKNLTKYEMMRTSDDNDEEINKFEKSIESDFEKIQFFRLLSIFFNEKEYQNEEWCCWNFKLAESIEETMNNRVTIKFTVPSKFKDNPKSKKLNFISDYPLKNMPSKLYSTFMNRVYSLDMTFKVGKNKDKIKILAKKIRLTKADRRFCPTCLKSSFLIPLYRFNKSNPFNAITDKTQLQEQEQFKLVELLGLEIPTPFTLKIKLVPNSDELTYSNLKRIIRKYSRRILTPFFFSTYYHTNSESFIFSILWLGSLIAVALHVYPLTTIVFIIIKYSGYLGAVNLSSKKLDPNAQKLNTWFIVFIVVGIGVLSAIFELYVAMTLVSISTFVMLFSGNAYYIVWQTMEYRDTIARLYRGDSKISNLLKKNWESNEYIEEIQKESLKESKEIKLSKFFSNLDVDQFTQILNRIYFEMATCATSSKRLFILEVTTTVGFVYILMVTILRYVVHIMGISSYIGSGSSYLIEVVGETTYGILLIFLLVINFGVFYAKIYLNLQMTKEVKRIDIEIDHVLELLKFIEATPDSIIEFKRKKDQSLDFTLTRSNLGIKFHEWYKLETINVLDALEKQLRVDNPENHKTTEALTNWICDHAKKSRLRLEFVKKQFNALTDIVRFKLFGVLEIDSSLLWNVLAATGTVLGTSLFAFFQSNFEIR